MLIRRARRLAAITLFAVAASGLSGCCGNENEAGWAAFLLGDDCGEQSPVSVEIVPPEGPVIAGSPVRLEVDVQSFTRLKHVYYWDLDGDRRTDRRLDLPHLVTDGSVEHTFPRAGRVRVGVELFVGDASDGGRDVDSLEIDVQPGPSGNRPPIAAFEAPTAIARGAGFLLDARPSRDEDGAIVRYSWDVEADSKPEFRGPSPEREHKYSTTGEKTITLTVEDDDGATAQARRRIVVTDDDRATTAAAAPRARARRFSARLTGLFAAPTARGLTLPALRGSGRLRAKLDSPVRPLGRLAKARWRGRLRFKLQARTGIARLRGRVIARGRGPRPPRLCLRLAIVARPFGRPATGRLTVLGGTRAAAFLRGSARFTVARVSGSAVQLNGRLKVRKRARPRGLAACPR